MKGASCGCGKKQKLLMAGDENVKEIVAAFKAGSMTFSDAYYELVKGGASHHEAQQLLDEGTLGGLKHYRCKSSKGYFGRFKSIDDAEAAAEAANIEEKNDTDDWESEEVSEPEPGATPAHAPKSFKAGYAKGFAAGLRAKASTAFNAGYAASQAGKPRHSNPYPEGSPDNEEWDKGFMEGLPSGLD